MIDIKTIEVGIKADAIDGFKSTSPEKAIEELIWNAIDAEAHNIQVVFHRSNEIDLVDRIEVIDDGHGIHYGNCEEVFASIGGSEKRLRRRSPNLDRPYHGQYGKGRYKALGIGKSITWKSRFQSANGQLQSYEVEISNDNLEAASISVPQDISGTSGCTVVIDKLTDEARTLQRPSIINKLTATFAPYMIAHPDLHLKYDGERLNYEEMINKQVELPVTLSLNSELHSEEDEFVVRIIVWNHKQSASLIWCDQNGISYDEQKLSIRGGMLPKS
ncbi:MAG: ATP-binding protein [Planctomycetaceae bacterium]|nr:ATP-binding protein [Planctomycetaceae bacterium]